MPEETNALQSAPRDAEASVASTAAILPAACPGASGPTAPQLVFALGKLGYDIATEALQDSITHHMDAPAGNAKANPYDRQQLLGYLEKNPWEATSLIWTLSLEDTPIYAVVPRGPFASSIYDCLRQFLKEQYTEGVERVSIPGVVVGSVRLKNGQVLPAIVPERRGMYSWTTDELIKESLDSASSLNPDLRAKLKEGMEKFLHRIYFGYRNLGTKPQDRALNYVATNVHCVREILTDLVTTEQEEVGLDTVEFTRSGLCRPDSECYDVCLQFFYPRRQVQTVRKVYRFTVDVSATVPVSIGRVESWFVR